MLPRNFNSLLKLHNPPILVQLCKTKRIHMTRCATLQHRFRPMPFGELVSFLNERQAGDLALENDGSQHLEVRAETIKVEVLAIDSGVQGRVPHGVEVGRKSSVVDGEGVVEGFFESCG